jgi:hypothetical protein
VAARFAAQRMLGLIYEAKLALLYFQHLRRWKYSKASFENSPLSSFQKDDKK